MEIRNQSIGAGDKDLRRTDITRRNRETIKQHLPPLPGSGEGEPTEPTADQAALAKRIQNAREKHAEKVETRATNARSEHEEAMAARIKNAREGYIAERIQNGRADRAERVENARTTEQAEKADRVKNAREVANQDEIDISIDARAIFGADESSADERAERIKELKKLFLEGALHDPARISRAAERLLADD